MSLFLATPFEIALHIAKSAKAKRLFLNLSQQSLSERSNVSLGVIKKFERTGKISLDSLLKVALVLDALEEFKELFKPIDPTQYLSLKQLMNEKKRKRGRL